MILFFGFRFEIKVSIKSVLGSLIFSLLQCNLWQLFGKCTGRDGKMWKNVEKCEKCADNPFLIYYSPHKRFFQSWALACLSVCEQQPRHNNTRIGIKYYHSV